MGVITVSNYDIEMGTCVDVTGNLWLIDYQSVASVCRSVDRVLPYVIASCNC